MTMPADTFEMYWECMRVIDSQEMMRSLTIADYPHTNKQMRKKIHRQLHRNAYPDTWDTSRGKVSVDQFFGQARVKDGE